MISIIDYKRGNIGSVYKALKYLNIEVFIAKTPEELDKADKIILPGVGAFGDGMEQLNNLGFSSKIKTQIAKGKPFLGICLGQHLLFEKSEEDPEATGLSIFKGKITKFQGNYKIPHMGWNQIEFKKDSKIKEQVPDKSFVYFVHSYMIKDCDQEIILATTNYNQEFVSAIEKDNITAFQFHPEKSQDTGLTLLKNWVKKC